MGPGLVSFLFSIGASTWLYTKFMKYSGNNTKIVVIATVVAFLVMFGVLFSILTLFWK